MDMLKSSREEDHRKRDEAQFYSIQQQLDELRRQLRENLARQQWFEEMHKQNEGKVSQIEAAHDRLSQDIAQTLHAKQMDDARVKAQIAELTQRAEAPEKQFREIRAQLQGLVDARKSDRDTDAEGHKQVEDIQRQMREINSHIGQVNDTQRQLRDLLQELDSALGEVRQEAVHVAELQSMEEQRLRRQGIELQNLFEALRQQFNDVAAKSQRVDDLRKQMTERIEAIEERLGLAMNSDTTINTELERIEKITNEQYLGQQDRIETMRVQMDSQLGEMRQVSDQRMDRIMNRFTGIDERLRAIEQTLAELPSRFEALERRDEMIGTETDTIEEWLVSRQLTLLEGLLDDVRKRRAERADALGATSKAQSDPTPGSVYNPAGLIKSVRDAKPPTRTAKEDGE